jgi:hypothetical protein
LPGVDHVHGVTYDGRHVWLAAGDTRTAFEPANGKTLRSIAVAAQAGTAVDGQHLFPLAGDRRQTRAPQTGRVLATIPAPGGGVSGLAWAEGTRWRGQDRTIQHVDPHPGAFFAPSRPPASSPGSPGSMGSAGTPPGKATTAR